MANPLRVMYWNACGLRHKHHLLRALLDEKDVDVALICETLLSPKIKLHFPGYYTYRRDYMTPDEIARRGLAVLVRRRVVHQVLPDVQLLSIQALGVELLNAGRPHRLYAVYRPHSQNLEVADIRNLLVDDSPTVLAGDWNAKNPAWNSSRTCPNGRRLLLDAETHGYAVFGPEVPTHYPFADAHMPDVIDIVVAKGLQQQPALEALCDAYGSDHVPILVTFHEATQMPQPTPRKRIDWNMFEENLIKHTPTRATSTPENVDALAEELTNAVGSALTAATTELPYNTKPPLPPRTKALIIQKRALRRRWQQTRCPTLKTQLNLLISRIKDALSEKAAEDWDKTIEAATDDYTSLHKLCRNFTKTPAPTRPLTHEDGNVRYRAADRAEILATHLERQFVPHSSHNSTHTEMVEHSVRNFYTTSIPAEEPITFFSPGMVKQVIAKTKPRKAPGVDGITNNALRHLPRQTIAAVTRLYNGIMRTGHFPGAWKMGLVVMIPKPGKNVLKPESYRPITLLPTISKVFEVLLLQKLTPHLSPRPEQFGFRAEHSTTQQLARVLHLLTAASNKKEKAAAVFLDMEKAFDRVWHPGMLYKIATSQTPLQLGRILQSFLENRSFKVKVDLELSSIKTIQAGVPQGSCLSPALYTLYTDDIPVPKDVTLALYADDAAYVATSLNHRHAAKKLQRALDGLPDWLQKWRMCAKVKKTQDILFGYRHGDTPNLSFLGESIPWTDHIKYLGLTIDRMLTMKPHIKKIVAQTRATTHALRPVLQSRLPLRAKVGVYKTYIRTRLTYAAPAWYALASESNRKTLRTQQSVALRRLTNAPRYVRNSTIQRDLRIESIDEFVVRLTGSVFARAATSTLHHIRDLAPWHARPPDRRAYPRDLLRAPNTEEE